MRNIILFLLISISSLNAEVFTFVSVLDFERPNAKLCKLVIKEACRRNGIETFFEVYPNKRATIMMKNGEVDGDILRVGTFKAENYVRIEEVIYRAPFVTYSLDKNVKITSWEDLKKSDKKIGYFSTAQKVVNIINNRLKIAPGKQVKINADYYTGFKMLLNNRFDILVLGFSTAEDTFNKYKELRDEVIFTGNAEEVLIYPFLHKKHETLSPIIAETIREMKVDGSFDRLKEEAGFIW